MIRSIPNHEGLLYLADLPSQDNTIEPCATYLAGDLHALWLHLCAINPKTREWLESDTDLDQVIIDALLAEDTRPRLLRRENGILINLRTINTLPGANPEDMISVRLWLTKNTVVTSRRDDARAVSDVQKAISTKDGPTSPGQFLVRLIAEIAHDIEEVTDDLEDQVARTEVRMVEKNETSDDLADFRRRGAKLAHYLYPQIAALRTLCDAHKPWLSEDNHTELIESLDQMTRQGEELHSLRDRLKILTEESRHLQSDRLNTTTYLFSIAATVFLPLSFLTGLMGINIGGMPGVDSGQAFWIFSGACVVIGTAQVILFKKLKWF